MRIAVVHDFMDTMGGGEKLALTMAKALHADFITTNLDMGVLGGFAIGPQRVRNLGRLPSLPPLKQIWASWRFFRFDYSDYDVVIFSGNWAIFGASERVRSFWYCHTPCREFFDLRADMRGSVPWGARFLFDTWASVHKKLYMHKIELIESIFCNSYFVKHKIKRYLKQEARVIYPPIRPMGQAQDKGKYWLAVSRIYPAKNIDMLIEVFRSLPHERLVLVGEAGVGDHSRRYHRRISADPASNVRLMSRQSPQELARIVTKAKAFISLAKDEDFGMGVAEAIASGLPVICSQGGGHEEIVEDGKNGFLVPLKKSRIKRAMQNITKIKNPQNTKDFSLKRFVKEIRKGIGS